MATETVIECRAEYAVGTAIFALRWFARRKTTGFKGYIWDEAFAFTAWTFFTLIYAMVEFLGMCDYQIHKHIADFDARSNRRSTNSVHLGTARSSPRLDEKVRARRRQGDVRIFLLPDHDGLGPQGLSHHGLPSIDVHSYT